MPIQCRMVTPEEMEHLEDAKPGDMWFAPWMVDAFKTPEELIKSTFVSPEYIRDWLGKRPPIVVILPNGDRFMVDKCCFDMTAGKQSDHGWTVTGEAPNITLSPSINCIRDNHAEGYHSYLRNGILEDDLEGRTY